MISLFVNTDENEPEPFTAAEHRAQSMRLLHQAGKPGTRQLAAANLLRAAQVHALHMLIAHVKEEDARYTATAAEAAARYAAGTALTEPPAAPDRTAAADVADSFATELAS